MCASESLTVGQRIFIAQSSANISAFWENAVTLLCDGAGMSKRTLNHGESRRPQTQARHLTHQLLVHSQIEACR